jgi:hypothetical protein
MKLTLRIDDRTRRERPVAPLCGTRDEDPHPVARTLLDLLFPAQSLMTPIESISASLN